MKSRLMSVLLCSVLGTYLSVVHAETWRVLTTNEPPLNFAVSSVSSVSGNTTEYAKGAEVTGLSTDIVNEILKRLASDTEIELLPWARGYKMLQNQDNVFLFSMSRTPLREDQFKWIGPIASKNQLLFGKKGSGIVINSLEEAKDVESIITLRDDSKEQYLMQQGFTNLYSTNAWPYALKKLQERKASLLTQTDLDIAIVAQQAGINLDAIEPVYTLMSTTLYIGASRNLPDDTVALWQNTLDEIKRDGTFAKLIDKWAKYYDAPNWSYQDGMLKIQ